jgi:hypothetical protein
MWGWVGEVNLCGGQIQDGKVNEAPLWSVVYQRGNRAVALNRPGEMAEWLKAHAWKACVPQGTVGSNPTLSARRKPPTGGSFPREENSCVVAYSSGSGSSWFPQS